MAAGDIAAVSRPIPAMRVETQGGVSFRLTYGDEPAVGFDRSRLDPALLDLARAAGADVRTGHAAATVDLDARRVRVRHADGDVRPHGAGGRRRGRSALGRWPGWRTSPGRRACRAASGWPTTWRTTVQPRRDARIRRDPRRVCRIAPAPGGRVNVGIVRRTSWRSASPRRRPRGRAIRGVVDPGDRRGSGDWRAAPPLDEVAGAWPIGGRALKRAGAGWLLVGDAAGFLDPFTGKVCTARSCRPSSEPRPSRRRCAAADRAFAAYDRAMARRFMAKYAVSWLVQAFLARPVLFDYAARRVASRDAVRATMGLVMGDSCRPVARWTRATSPRSWHRDRRAMHPPSPSTSPRRPTSCSASPATSSAGPTSSPTTRARRLVSGVPTARSSWTSSPAGRSSRSSGSACRSRGVRGCGRSPRSGACGSSTWPGRRRAWT